MRILIVEDEVQLSEALAEILEKNKYIVDKVFDGESGLDNILCDIYDVVILDIMLPKMNGIEIVKKVRENGISTPIILLTAKGQVEDKIEGLDSGADDYLPKPFVVDELLARIRALGRRRGEVQKDNYLTFGDIKLNMQKFELKSNENTIKLTAKEAYLMEIFIKRKDMITNKDDIITKLWGYESDVEHNNVEVYVSFIRRKLNHLKSKVSIKAIRSLGYVLKFNDEEK